MEYTKEMREISGFGGGYEETCRNMVIAGATFLKQNPNVNPKYKGFKNVTGVCIDDNEDAKKLDEILMEACKKACTGAMHQAAVSHALFIGNKGWEEYKKIMTEEKQEAES